MTSAVIGAARGSRRRPSRRPPRHATACPPRSTTPWRPRRRAGPRGRRARGRDAHRRDLGCPATERDAAGEHGEQDDEDHQPTARVRRGRPPPPDAAAGRSVPGPPAGAGEHDLVRVGVDPAVGVHPLVVAVDLDLDRRRPRPRRRPRRSSTSIVVPLGRRPEPAASRRPSHRRRPRRRRRPQNSLRRVVVPEARSRAPGPSGSPRARCMTSPQKSSSSTSRRRRSRAAARVSRRSSACSRRSLRDSAGPESVRSRRRRPVHPTTTITSHSTTWPAIMSVVVRWSVYRRSTSPWAGERPGVGPAEADLVAQRAPRRRVASQASS